MLKKYEVEQKHEEYDYEGRIADRDAEESFETENLLKVSQLITNLYVVVRPEVR